MNKNSVFNPNGNSFKEDEKIFGGNHTGILVLTDMKYSWVMPLIQYSRKNIWFPDTIDYKSDSIQIDQALSVQERRAVLEFLGFLIYLDSVQTTQPLQLSPYISSPAVNALLANQAREEMVHSWSYSFSAESIFSGDEKRTIFEMWRNNPLMMKRNKFIADIYDNFRNNPSDESIVLSLSANYSLESIYFYNGFKLFYSLESRGLMNGTAQNIRYINRDEVGHIQLYKNIFLEARKEKVIKINDDAIIDVFEKGVQHEIDFSNDLLVDILGFNETVIKDYTRFRANKALSEIGITNNPFAEYVKNPFKKWDNEFEGEIMRESNVFTGKNVNYTFGLVGFDKF